MHTIDSYLDIAIRRVRRRLGWYFAAVAWSLLSLGFGAYAAGQLSALQRSDLLAYLGGFLGSLQHGVPQGPALMRAALYADGRLFLLSWLLALVVVGVVTSWLWLAVKGFSIGFTSAFLLGELGGRGLLVVLLGVLPPAMLVLPSIWLLSESAALYASDFYRARLKAPQMISALVRFAGTGAIAASGLVLAATAQAYLSPLALHLLWPYVGG